MSTARSSVHAVTLTGHALSTEMAAGDIVEYQFDASPLLGAGQAPTNPTVQLIDTRTGEVVIGGAALDTVPIEGAVLFIRVANVARGRRYELRIGFDHTNPRVAGEHTNRVHIIEGKP